MNIFSGTISLLEKALDYSAKKQNIISHNIANVDTPNFKAKEAVAFKTYLQKELNVPAKANRTHGKHLSFTAANRDLIVNRPQVRYNESGNSVDIDQEMTKLAANQIYYNAMADRINGKFQTLQTVIKGGK